MQTNTPKGTREGFYTLLHPGVNSKCSARGSGSAAAEVNKPWYNKRKLTPFEWVHKEKRIADVLDKAPSQITSSAASFEYFFSLISKAQQIPPQFVHAGHENGLISTTPPPPEWRPSHPLSTWTVLMSTGGARGGLFGSCTCYFLLLYSFSRDTSAVRGDSRASLYHLNRLFVFLFYLWLDV